MHTAQAKTFFKIRTLTRKNQTKTIKKRYKKYFRLGFLFSMNTEERIKLSNLSIIIASP